MIAHATQGKYSSTGPQDITALEAIKRWDVDNGEVKGPPLSPDADPEVAHPAGRDLAEFIRDMPKIPHAEPFEEGVPDFGDGLLDARAFAKSAERVYEEQVKQVTINQENCLVIETVSNGAILTDYEGHKEVFRYETPEVGAQDELAGAQELLWRLIDLLGLAGSKWDKERMAVKVVHGHGYECKLKKGKCPICSEK